MTGVLLSHSADSCIY